MYDSNSIDTSISFPSKISKTPHVFIGHGPVGQQKRKIGDSKSQKEQITQWLEVLKEFVLMTWNLFSIVFPVLSPFHPTIMYQCTNVSFVVNIFGMIPPHWCWAFLLESNHRNFGKKMATLSIFPRKNTLHPSISVAPEKWVLSSKEGDSRDQICLQAAAKSPFLLGQNSKPQTGLYIYNMSYRYIMIYLESEIKFNNSTLQPMNCAPPSILKRLAFSILISDLRWWCHAGCENHGLLHVSCDAAQTSTFGMHWYWHLKLRLVYPGPIECQSSDMLRKTDPQLQTMSTPSVSHDWWGFKTTEKNKSETKLKSFMILISHHSQIFCCFATMTAQGHQKEMHNDPVLRKDPANKVSKDRGSSSYPLRFTWSFLSYSSLFEKRCSWLWKK